MKYLLDTDHLSFLELGIGLECSRIERRMAMHPRRDVGCAIVSLHEQFLGCQAYIAKARNEPTLLKGYYMLQTVFEQFVKTNIVPFQHAEYAELARLQAAPVRINTMDLRIGATALANNLILVTRNTVDFNKVPGLVLEDWTI
jgi:tRNA(fMet)-specific endonuclease VapC